MPQQEGAQEPEASSDTEAGTWSHSWGASTKPSWAIGLRGRRISAGLSNNGLQPPGSFRYWKHMFSGEKEKKQLNIHTIAVSRRVRETRAHGWGGSGRGHGDGLQAAACTAQKGQLPPPKICNVCASQVSAGSEHQTHLEEVNKKSNEKTLECS